MKTVTLDEDVWKRLLYLKLDLNKATLSETVTLLLDEYQKPEKA